MAEVLFVLLTVYVVYVVQSVVYKREEKTENSPVLKPKAAVETAKSEPQEIVAEQAESAIKKPVAKKATTEKSKPKAMSKAKPVSKKKLVADSLRNPETGEVDKVANSYRMTKRWIKEALVTEGLLPKIYKTAELNDSTKKKAKTALSKLAKMDKYQ